MRWLLSRLHRKDLKVPRVCYALFHAPESLTHECDCEIFCKWPPRGNAPDAAPVVVDDGEELCQSSEYKLVQRQ